MEEGQVKVLIDNLLEEIGDKLPDYSLNQLIEKLEQKSGESMKQWKTFIKTFVIKKVVDITRHKEITIKMKPNQKRCPKDYLRKKTNKNKCVLKTIPLDDEKPEKPKKPEKPEKPKIV